MQKRLRLRYLIKVKFVCVTMGNSQYKGLLDDKRQKSNSHKATQKSALAPTPRADSSFIGQLKPEQINEGPSKGDECI